MEIWSLISRGECHMIFYGGFLSLIASYQVLYGDYFLRMKVAMGKSNI